MIVVTFCPSCGDRVPGLPHEVTGGPLDETHTYVQTGPDRYDNMARLAGHDAAGMPAYLRVDHDHGEVIVPVQNDPAPPIVVVRHDYAGGALALAGALIGAVVARRALRRRKRHVPRL